MVDRRLLESEELSSFIERLESRMPLSEHNLLDHSRRHRMIVTNFGMFLSTSELFNLRKDIVLACYLHDSGRLYDGSDPEHAKRGAEIARKEINISFPERDIVSIVWAIENHSLKQAPNGKFPIVSNFDVPERVNGKIAIYLWDADRLDLLRLPRYREIDTRYLHTQKAKDFANSSCHKLIYGLD
jgi:hypothetical protein